MTRIRTKARTKANKRYNKSKTHKKRCRQEIHLNHISKIILEYIRNKGKVTDKELVSHLSKIYSKAKEKNIRRRKYDVISIVEETKWIIVNRQNKNRITYESSYGQMNNKLTQVISKVRSKKEEIQNLKKKIQFLKNTKKNIKSVIDRNYNKRDCDVQRVNLPILVCTQNFDSAQRTYNEDDNKQILKLSFNKTTKFIGNILVQQALFSTKSE